MRPDPLVELALGPVDAVRQARRAQQLAARPVEHDPPVVAAEAPASHPRDLAHRAELVEEPWLVARDAGRQDVALEDRRRDRQPRELVHDLREALERGRAPERHDRDPRRRRWRDPLPGGEEPGERDRVDGLDLAPQLRERPAPEQAEDLGIAVLALGATGPELAGEQRARVDQPVERVLDDARREAPAARRLRPEERPVRAGPAGEQPVERPDDRPEERLRHAGRRARADPVAVARDVLHRDPALLAADPRTHGAAGRRELGQVDRRLDATADGPRTGLVRREVAEAAQQVVDLVRVRRVALVGERLEAELEVREGVRVEQLAQLLLAQQLAEEVAVQRQRLCAALRERGVAVVHVRRHVVEQQAPGERGRLRGLDAVDGDLAARHAAEDLAQGREVEHVREALAVRLHEDREAAVAARDGQEVGGPLALLPQRRPGAGAATREEQRAGRVLAEPAREQR